MAQGKHAQEIGLVTRQFEKQLAHYTSEKRSARSARIVSFLAAARERGPRLPAGRALQVCEFGGADGLLLRSVRERLSEEVELVNAELVEAFAAHQACAEIRFVRTSILGSAFPDAAFDVVIARHVLHHLVADSFDATRRNQAKAFAELARVTRPGGWVLMEEHVNPSAFACRLFYRLSRLAVQLKLSLPWYEVTPYTVVAFLTPGEFRSTALRATRGVLQQIAEEMLPATIPLQWRLTLLRRNSGNLFAAYRVAQ